MTTPHGLPVPTGAQPFSDGWKAISDLGFATDALIMSSMGSGAGNQPRLSVRNPGDVTGGVTLAYAEVQLDSHNGWNATTHAYTVPVSGPYLVVINVQIEPPGAASGAAAPKFMVNGAARLSTGYLATVTYSGGDLTGIVDLIAGDIVSVIDDTSYVTWPTSISNYFQLMYVGALAGVQGEPGPPGVRGEQGEPGVNAAPLVDNPELMVHSPSVCAGGALVPYPSVRADNYMGWNSSTYQYTVPMSGLYHFDLQCKNTGVNAPVQAVQINGVGSFWMSSVTAPDYAGNGLSGYVQLNVGDVVGIVNLNTFTAQNDEAGTVGSGSNYFHLVRVDPVTGPQGIPGPPGPPAGATSQPKLQVKKPGAVTGGAVMKYSIVDHDSENRWNAATHTYVVPMSGPYLAIVNCQLTFGADGVMSPAVRVNGLGRLQSGVLASATNWTGGSISGILDLVAGDLVDVYETRVDYVTDTTLDDANYFHLMYIGALAGPQGEPGFGGGIPWSFCAWTNLISIADGTWSNGYFTDAAVPPSFAFNSGPADLVNGRLVIPTDGIYTGHINVRWLPDNVGLRCVNVNFNDTPLGDDVNTGDYRMANLGVYTYTKAFFNQYLAAGTTIHANLYQNCGVALNCQMQLFVTRLHLI